jgi:hypothetical protein
MKKIWFGVVLAVLVIELIGGTIATKIMPSGCNNLYWIDNDNKSCGKKEFCGSYMYYGLFTFENETACQQYVLASSGGIANDSGCNNLYWIDNDNKSCGKKEFCGMYMYYGLQTFESKTQCEKAAGLIDEEMDFDTYQNLYCPKQNHSENWCKYGEITKEYDNYSCPTDKCMFNLSNGRKAEVKIMPEAASQTAIQRLGDLGFTVELKEVGTGNNKEAVYELTGNKQGKFLGIFKIMASEKVQVDAETGEVKKVIKPWWAFLASGI